MARREHLPIYKAAYDLYLYLEQVVRGFSRYHKYGLRKKWDHPLYASPITAASAPDDRPAPTDALSTP